MRLGRLELYLLRTLLRIGIHKEWDMQQDFMLQLVDTLLKKWEVQADG